MKTSQKHVIFMDRDGVINRDPGGWTDYDYVTRWEEFIFLPHSIEALKKLTLAGYEIVVISNQAGVNKGHYTKNELTEINRKMLEELEKAGAKLRKVYYCIHEDSDNCDCRKPKTGLFKQAEKELAIKSQDSFFVGDGRRDVEAGKRMGLKTILVLSGKTLLKDVESWPLKPDFIFDDLLSAVNFILEMTGEK